MQQRIFAFDFEGVIGHSAGGFKGHDYENIPNDEVVAAIRILKEQGHMIIVHSTRDTGFLQRYCYKHDIPVDYYNENPHFENQNPGKPVATVYIDDRAYCYRGQSRQDLVDALNAFEPHRPRAKDTQNICYHHIDSTPRHHRGVQKENTFFSVRSVPRDV